MPVLGFESEFSMSWVLLVDLQFFLSRYTVFCSRYGTLATSMAGPQQKTTCPPQIVVYPL